MVNASLGITGRNFSNLKNDKDMGNIARKINIKNTTDRFNNHESGEAHILHYN
jgi:hypothetical protein